MAGEARQKTKKPASLSRYFAILFIPPQDALSELKVLAVDDMVCVSEIFGSKKQV